MRALFDCDRMTDDLKSTDMYCEDYDLYTNHVDAARDGFPFSFGCGRVTLDARPTDKYCEDSDLYLTEVINGSAAPYLN